MMVLGAAVEPAGGALRSKGSSLMSGRAAALSALGFHSGVIGPSDWAAVDEEESADEERTGTSSAKEDNDSTTAKPGS